MKKKITVIIALFCIISMIVAFAACDKGNTPDAGTPSGDAGSGVQSGNIGSGTPSGEVGSGSQSGVNEMQQFRRVMTAVLNEFSSRMTATVSLTSALSGEASSGEDNGFEKSAALKEIYDYMDTVEGKEVIDEKTINEYAIRNFLAARSYGELINQICETDQIYGAPIKINNKESSSSPISYAVVLSEGRHIIVYLFGSDDKDVDFAYKWDIDYVSDNEFSAKMITMSEGKPMCYIYGDTDGDSLSIWGSNDRGEIQYKASGSDKCHSLSDYGAIENCFAKVKYEYDSIDFEYLRTLKDTFKNTAEQQQYDDIANALCKEYGID